MSAVNTTARPAIRGGRRRAIFVLLAVIAALVAAGAGSATASAAPALRVTTLIPDHVTPGKSMVMFITITNAGDEPMSGNASIDYTFPGGISVGEPEAEDGSMPTPTCTPSGQVNECTIDVTGVSPSRNLVYRTFSEVDPGATGTLTGQIEVSGGGAGNSVTVPLLLDTAPIGPFEVKNFDVGLIDGPAFPAIQAGGVPGEAVAAAELRSTATSLYNVPVPQFTITSGPESMRDVVTHVPAGFVGYPTATPLKCTAAQLAEPAPAPQQVPLCPQDSQLGVVLVNGKDLVPLYNLVAPQGVPAQFGFYYLGIVVTLHAELRPSDNGIDVVSETVPSSVPVSKFEATFWGVPADSSHDRLRPDCTFALFGNDGSLCPSEAPKVPFLRLPTSCSGGPLPWSLDIDTYQNPGVFHRRETTTPALENCQSVPFDPSLSVTPSERSAHSASGLDVDLTVPQENGPAGISQADLRAVTLALPEGVSVNPASADGLEACSDGQLRLGLEGPSDCPDAAKLGSIELNTPLLDHPIGGSVFLRTQASKDPASGEMYRLAIELRSDDDGVDVKLPGSLKADPGTGQLTTTFSGLPQLPFESMQLHLKAGPRAPLTTPQACGTYAAEATLTGWNGKTVAAEPGFTVDQNCDAPGFAPGFQAGVANPTAGAFSPFTLRVTRDSGQPNLSRIDATLPEGELAKLAGVPVCPDAQAASGGCSEASRIGRVVAAVGEGSSPLYIPQAGKAPTAVFLTGPYKGAPYSVLTAVPAQSGPFDLGTVLVRSALRIDPATAQASVDSDPLPQIFGGIPVSYRDVRVEVDRPEFTINPTSCDPMSVTGTIGSVDGGSANVSDRFQVSDCAALGFKPKLSFSLAGRTTRSGNPALTAVLRMPQKGKNANVSRAVVSLPGSEFLAQGHIQTVCTRVQYTAGGGGGAECPKGSVYGRARAFSPLLDQPLEGPVYLRSNGGDRELPDLVASLGGQIHVDLVGYIDSNPKTGGIRTSFANVPDAPVSKFVLKMPGGKKSLLENSTNICRGKHRAIVKMDGQNGKVHDFRPLVRARCGKRAR
ncbi:MAG: hypothetical protein QOF06_1660 [Solirubrobacterales bacterium]|jgi:hypothetical protein|nr:hypothetical protein [Solirubrobacterales bacterium]